MDKLNTKDPADLSVLLDAVEDAAGEAKEVLVRHAEQQKGGDQVSLVMLATIEMLGGMVGAALLNRNPAVAKEALAVVDLYMPPLIDALRRKVEADEANNKEEEADEHDRGQDGDEGNPAPDDQLPVEENSSGIAEPSVSDGE